MTNEEQKTPLICSFCGRSQKEVAHMIHAELANICDECVKRCDELIFQRVKGDIK